MKTTDQVLKMLPELERMSIAQLCEMAGISQHEQLVANYTRAELYTMCI